MEVTVITPSRLACCLIDLNGSRGRVDGCLGIALQEPRIRVRVRAVADKLQVIWPGNEVSMLEEVAQRVKDTLGIQGGAIIEVQDSYPAHCGLGRTTQLYLAMAAGLAAVYERKVAVRELATLVHRGGTSGAGVAVFENGGVVLDGGHTFGEGKEKQSFLPSSRTQAPPAPLLARYRFPNDWRVVCVRLEGVSGKSGEEEAAFFARCCPIDATDVAETCWILLMQFLPALVSKDLKVFNGAIDSLQRTSFKKAIWQSQPAKVHVAKHIMEDFGLMGVGLSSLGPTLYCVVLAKEARAIAAAVQNALRKRTISAIVWTTQARNNGAHIQYSYEHRH